MQAPGKLLASRVVFYLVQYYTGAQRYRNAQEYMEVGWPALRCLSMQLEDGRTRLLTDAIGIAAHEDGVVAVIETYLPADQATLVFPRIPLRS